MSEAPKNWRKPVGGARFPVIRLGIDPPDAPDDIPWEIVERYQRRAMANHGHDLNTLHNRGGLCWCEILALIEDRPVERERPGDFARVKEIARQRGYDM